MFDGWTDLTCSKWDRMQVNAALTKEDTAAGMETGVRSAGERHQSTSKAKLEGRVDYR
jgi:hypothetical protein